MKNIKEKPIEVPVGRIKHNSGPLISHGFTLCSALILDFGNEAIMAHALPLGTPGHIYKGPYATQRTVVQKILEKTLEKGLDFSKAKAIIHTGEKETLERISADLSKFKIPIEVTNLHKDPSKDRTILYDPSTSYLGIRRTTENDIILV